jgi:hypothetical protein
MSCSVWITHAAEFRRQHAEKLVEVVRVNDVDCSDRHRKRTSSASRSRAFMMKRRDAQAIDRLPASAWSIAHIRPSKRRGPDSRELQRILPTAATSGHVICITRRLACVAPGSEPAWSEDRLWR